jgi:hypothetical protein
MTKSPRPGEVVHKSGDTERGTVLWVDEGYATVDFSSEGIFRIALVSVGLLESDGKGESERPTLAMGQREIVCPQISALC